MHATSLGRKSTISNSVISNNLSPGTARGGLPRAPGGRARRRRAVRSAAAAGSIPAPAAHQGFRYTWGAVKNMNKYAVFACRLPRAGVPLAAVGRVDDDPQLARKFMNLQSSVSEPLFFLLFHTKRGIKKERTGLQSKTNRIPERKIYQTE